MPAVSSTCSTAGSWSSTGAPPEGRGEERMTVLPKLLCTSAILVLAAAAAAAGPPANRHRISIDTDHGVLTVRRDADPIVEGSGRLIHQARDLPAFSGIRVAAGAHLEVEIGPRAAVDLEIDDNLAD